MHLSHVVSTRVFTYYSLKKTSKYDEASENLKYLFNHKPYSTVVDSLQMFYSWNFFYNKIFLIVNEMTYTNDSLESLDIEFL